jgi:hypothetical protein
MYASLTAIMPRNDAESAPLSSDELLHIAQAPSCSQPVTGSQATAAKDKSRGDDVQEQMANLQQFIQSITAELNPKDPLAR